MNVKNRARNHHHRGAGSGVAHKRGMEIVPELFVCGDHGVLLPAPIGGRKSEVLRLMEAVIVFFLSLRKAYPSPSAPSREKIIGRTTRQPTTTDIFFFILDCVRRSRRDRFPSKDKNNMEVKEYENSSNLRKIFLR